MIVQSASKMPKDDLRYLVKHERTLRGSMDNIKSFITHYREDRDRSSVETRMNKLDEIFEKFLDVRMRIEVITDDQEDDNFVDTVQTEEERKSMRMSIVEKREQENVNVIRDFEDEYYSVKQSLLAFAVPAGRSTDPVLPQSRGSMPIESQIRVKLPELKLPMFSGKLREWITFRDSFTSMIHDNEHLSTIDKFTYLRTSVTGDALREIASIELSAANYTIAWSTLKSNYENKKLIAKSYLDALFAIKSMEKESYEQLNRVVGEFETNVMMLQKIGEETDGMSTILQHMVCQRLDQQTLRHWENHHNSVEIPTYKTLELGA